jgi:hypothetical protein
MCLRLRDVTGIRLKLGEGMRHLGGRVYLGLEYVAGPGHYIDRHHRRRGPLQQFRFTDSIAFNLLPRWSTDPQQ